MNTLANTEKKSYGGYDKVELEQELKAAKLCPAQYDPRNAELVEP
jgi:hypothetical protein